MRSAKKYHQLSMELVTTPGVKNTLFLCDDQGLFNASSIAKEYGKEVYGYTRSQKIKDLVKNISLEYNLNPDLEFTDQGNIVRVITGGIAPGTWMHLDIFIKFLGWLDPKLERDFLKSAFNATKQQDIDPLQIRLASLESEITSLKRKLSRNPIYKDLVRKKREVKLLQKEMDKNLKLQRKQITTPLVKSIKSSNDNEI